MGEVPRLNMDFVDEREIEALKLYLPEVKKMIQVLLSCHTENEKVYVPAIRKLKFARDALETVTQRKFRFEMVDVEKTLIRASQIFPILRFIRLPPVVFPENMNIERPVSSTPRIVHHIRIMGEVPRLNMDFVDEREIEALKLYLPEVKKMIQVLLSHHTENEKVYVPAIRKLKFARDALETVTQRKLRFEMVDVEKTLIRASHIFPILQFIRLPPVVFPENMNIERPVSSTPRDSKVLKTQDPLSSKSSDIVNSSDRGGERLTERSESANQIISNISASDQRDRRLAETSGLRVNKELKSLSIPRKRKSDNQEFAQQNVSEKYKKRSSNATQ